MFLRYLRYPEDDMLGQWDNHGSGKVMRKADVVPPHGYR